MRNGFLKWWKKKVQNEVAPVERGKRWSGRTGRDGKIERRMEC